MPNKCFWLTDLHLLPKNRKALLQTIAKNSPDKIFLTGDISVSAGTFLKDLEFMGQNIAQTIYFIYGNHDVWLSSFEYVKSQIIDICSKYKNLVWLTDSDSILLNDETSIIGTEGWYSTEVGNKYYTMFTVDWIVIKELRCCDGWKERFDKFKSLANQSAELISSKLLDALTKSNIVYLLTHFPPWLEAYKCSNKFVKTFWTPYNINVPMGTALKKIMAGFPNKKLVVLAGHTHSSFKINISENIECRIGGGGTEQSDQETTFLIENDDRS